MGTIQQNEKMKNSGSKEERWNEGEKKETEYK